MTKPPPKPQPPYAPTYIPGGLNKVFRIWEDMRERNANGYVPGGGLLANVRDHGMLSITKGTTCSPFTATVIALAFDPVYPRNDLPVKGGDPYVPMFNGGHNPLPFLDFYHEHNNYNKPIESIVDYNLGIEIPMTEMRRGDLLGIGWNDKNQGGHAVFCWDVHLNENGEVDCFQYLGANSWPGLWGVTIGWCGKPDWLDGQAKNGKTAGDLHRVKIPMFVDDDKVVEKGQWLALPDVAKGSINTKTFRVTPRNVYYKTPNTFTVRAIRVGRLHYEGDPPKPYCMKNGAAPAKAPAPPGHVETPAIVVKGPGIKHDPEAPKKVPPKPATQDKDKPTNWQHYVEHALQMFHGAKWVESDPGKTDNINDAASQAAIKEFQKKFKLDVDGIVGKHTLAAVGKQLSACMQQVIAQLLLGSLYRGKKLDHDPGLPDGTNHDLTRAAVEEFQKKYGLDVTGVPDADTLAKIIEICNNHEATEAKPGLEPTLRHLYWVGSPVEPGGSATLRLHSRDLIVGQECPIHLKDEVSGKEVDAAVKLKIDNAEVETVVVIPSDFGVGARLRARIVADLKGDGTLEASTSAPLEVRSKQTPETETADWRPYIGKDEVPGEVLDAIKRNRARYPMKNLVLVKGKYAGEHHYDYNPPAAHAKWAKDYFQQKVDTAPPGSRQVPKAFLVMLDAEGRPASLQTYDNQIVTWGVGLGAKGDGVHAFTHLNKDAGMRKLLDDLGINYDGGDYHVVDLRTRKVVSSSPGRKGDDNRHIVALKAWREQPDLLSAIIGISEDPATREAVAESQYAVYLSNSTGWPGQDKVFTGALFFMIVHLHHWMPAIAKYGFNVEDLFQAIGGGTPSVETDRQLAPRVARKFVSYAKTYFLVKQNKKSTYDDIHDRTKSHVWKKLREDGRKESFDPGELTYDDTD